MGRGKSGPFTALILAGSRPGGDPLARAFGLPHKAMIPVAGVPMLSRVARALREATMVGGIAVSGLDASLVEHDVELGELRCRGDVTLLAGGSTPSASVYEAAKKLATPLLVTTADHPLLTSRVVDSFCRDAMDAACDVAVGLVRAERVRAAFPSVRRTSLPFRDGAYCGCNLFALLTREGERAPLLWMRVESHRKQPWKIVRELGTGVALRFLLRRLTLDEALRLASQKMEMRARAVVLSEPEAGFDVDRESHLEAADDLLRRREGLSPPRRDT